MLNVKYIILINDPFISEHTISIQPKLGIQFIWSGFKSMKFNDY